MPYREAWGRLTGLKRWPMILGCLLTLILGLWIGAFSQIGARQSCGDQIAQGTSKQQESYGEQKACAASRITVVSVVHAIGYTLRGLTTDGVIAGGTVGLALATLILVLVNVSLVKSTKIAADAAREAAEALPILESARFYIVVLKHSMDQTISAARALAGTDGVIMDDAFWIRINFKNYGKTPGIIKEISQGHFVDINPRDGLVYTTYDKPLNEDVIGADDTTEEITYYGRLGTPTTGEIIQIHNGAKFLWYYGKVEYTDVFGKPHTHRFLKRCVLAGARFRFQSYDYKHYNESS
jgi:hypothetical protein